MQSFEPSKTKHFTDSRRLPFEPSMADIMEAYRSLAWEHGCAMTEVLLEDRVEHGSGTCSRCNDGSYSYSVLVFSKLVSNENYETELAAYQLEQDKERARKEEREALERRAEESFRARLVWKQLQRNERIARRHLGRHTMIHTA